MTSNTLHSLILEMKYKLDDLYLELEIDKDWLEDNENEFSIKEFITKTEFNISHYMTQIADLERIIGKLEKERQGEDNEQHST